MLKIVILNTSKPFNILLIFSEIFGSVSIEKETIETNIKVCINISKNLPFVVLSV